MPGSPEDLSAEILPLNSAEEHISESDQLDDALASATDSMLRSLDEEDQRRKQQKLVWAGLALFVGAILVIVGAFAWTMRSAQREQELETVKQSWAYAETPDERLDPATLPFRPGDFTMHLPKGFQWPVTIQALSQTEYRFISPKALNSLGIYELKGNLLAMKKPVDKRLTEFQWRIVDKNNLVMVAEPPARKTGGNYLGTKLIRKD